MVPVNYLAILACGIVSMGLGTLWFGPLFGRVWMAGSGITEEAMNAAKSDPVAKRAMMRSYAIMFGGSLVMAFVLAHAIVFASSYLQVTGIAAALQAALWNWIGFIAPVSVGSVLWEGKSWKYWFVTGGYYLVQLILFSIILVLWP